MAAKDQDTNGTNAPTATPMASAFANANQQRQQQGQAGQPAIKPTSFLRTRDVRSAMGRTPASEALSKIEKAVAAVLAENVKSENGFEVKLMSIDKEQTSDLDISVLIVTAVDKTAPEVGVAYHTLLIEGSSDPFPPKFEVFNGKQEEIIRVTSDAENQILVNTVEALVKRQYPSLRTLSTGSCVVPRDFKVDDQDLVFKLTQNAAFACTAELVTANPQFADLSLAGVERDSTLVVRHSFNNPQQHDAVGMPIRSDILIDLSAQPLQTQAGAISDRTSPVAYIRGFLDIQWDPSGPIQNAMGGMFGMQTQAQISYQRYVPRFVMTGLESAGGLSVASQLLALVTAVSLRDNGAWMQAFRPTGFDGENSLRDIGAIGIECNFENNPNGVGSRIDTSAAKFQPQHLSMLIGQTFKPGLIISLDVSEAGPDTWYNGIFASAAEGNQRSNQIIIDAANRLTNGAFTKYWSGGRVAVDENNRIHMGYYTDSHGVRRDIRDIDMLAVLNRVGEQDPETAREWSNTYTDVRFPINMRLAVRKRIISGIFTNVTITGFARRVSFDGSFIEALARGAADMNLSARTVSQYTDMVGELRAVSPFTAQTMLSGDTSGIFTRGSGAQPHPMGLGRQFGAGRF